VTPNVADPATVTMRLSGSDQTLELVPWDTILEAARQIRDDAPNACLGGARGTCRGRLVAGAIEMDQNLPLGWTPARVVERIGT
jgi:ferredoxin